MISSIGCENYKAFSKAELQLKPITILLGANSSGKSSLVQLLLMLEQTFNTRGQYKSALKLNGNQVRLGEPDNIFKDLKFVNPLVIEFGIDIKEYETELNSSYRDIYERALVVLSYFWVKSKGKKKSFIEWCESNKVSLPIKNGDLPFDYDVISKYYRRNDDSIFYYLSYRVSHRNDFDLERLDKTDFVKYCNILSDFQTTIRKHLIKCKEQKILYKYYIKMINGKLESYSAGVYHGDVKLLEYHYSKCDNNCFSSDVYSFHDEHTECNKYHLFLRCFEPCYESDNNFFSPIEEFKYNVLHAAYTCVKPSFDEDKITYISPLRAYPQRYYLLDESNDSQLLKSNSGTSLAEILKSKEDITKSVNEWIEKFGISVSVKPFKDIINNIKITQNGNNLDITDVGFGVSQVLPIITQCFLAREESLTIIEQPEIHLHPKLQADLMDLFIDVALKTSVKNKIFLIETHSEYMIKRLRRRIAEGENIQASDVALYFIEPRNENNPDGAIINAIDISEDGEIKWPQDYYETSLQDDIAYINAVVSRKKL